jgi:hypothetical protein
MAAHGSVRRSQVVTTYGPGALVAVGDESFMVAGIHRWAVQEADAVPERRLEDQLRVHSLYLPPSEGDAFERARGLPVIRFPLMHSCPGCKRLDWHWHLSDGDRNTCNRCDRPLVPSRFVTACDAGHIEDFPYSRWVHGGRAGDGDHRLELTATGKSAALRDIVVKCSCGAARSLEGAFDRKELSQVARCNGRRPWLGDQEDCGAALRTLQRGASNVWFSSVRSALSIPPWSDGVFQLLERHWLMLKTIRDPAMLRNVLQGMGAALTAHGHDIEEIVRAVLARQAEEAGDRGDAANFRRDEYGALLAGREERDQDQQFVATAGPPPDGLGDHFDRVAIVPRLREVRVLVGFTRLHPPSADESEATATLAPLANGETGWLPAIEVKGEGLFLRWDEQALAAWESRDAVRGRVGDLDERHRALAEQRKIKHRRRVTPRLVMIHTFAHVLIDQMSLDAGYPAASLRERLYVDEDMRGLLIYTATSDSAGSLGGVVAQGAPDRLEGLVREAVNRAAWCSADPVCVEATVTGADGLNAAACHACALLPEVSCEERNMLLDRALLVGTPNKPELGYFVQLLEEA